MAADTISFALVVTAAVGLLSGCGDESVATTGPACLAAEVGTCDCGAGLPVGTRTCNPLGAWEACACASDMGGGDIATAVDTDGGAGQEDVAGATDVLEADGGASDSGGATDAVQMDASLPDTQGGDLGIQDATATTTCKSDKDCKAFGLVCEPLGGHCVPCLTDADCGAAQHCKNLACLEFAACQNSLDCTGTTTVCDANLGECVGCQTAADCGAAHDCKDHVCQPYTPCQTSTQCPVNQVCDQAAKRCVDCNGDNDCGPSTVCENGVCRAFTACASDKTCTPLGLLCDPGKGKCAQCLKNSDCPDVYNCQPVGVGGTGACVLDVCAQGNGTCLANAKVVCNAAGDGYAPAVSCGGAKSCVVKANVPVCQ